MGWWVGWLGLKTRPGVIPSAVVGGWAPFGKWRFGLQVQPLAMDRQAGCIVQGEAGAMHMAVLNRLATNTH